MSWDGNGGFVRTKDWTNDRDASVKILASRHDENDDELRDGIGACLTKDGQSKPTADFKPNADVTYSLGSSVLRWVNVWLSGALKFKQTNFAATLQAATLTADRTHTLPDTAGTIVVNGVAADATPDVVNDSLFSLDVSDTNAPKVVNITTLANAIGALAAFHSAASTTAAGDVELATSTETLAGSDALRAVTPAGIAAMCTIDNPGHIKLPGGIIINFGWSTSFSGSTPISFTYSLAFPNAVLGFSSGHVSGTNGATTRATTVGLSSCTLVTDGVGGGSSAGFIVIGW